MDFKRVVPQREIVRIKINLPQKGPVYSTDIRVSIGDINYGQHMGNEKILSFCHEARLRFLKHHDLSELHFFQASLIMADSACVYKKEVLWGDLLTVDLYLGERSSYGFDLIYVFHAEKKEVARAKTGMVFFDYKEKKLISPSLDFQTWFEKLLLG